ncbi:DNA primase [Ruminococcus sp. YE71]|uniref:DNA primase n=1 Tax=unclassified Ruminococcus TaxID=2608920 RepID=UPI000880B554|nr:MULTISPECIES: DNA primase [unclassified Ruminococcus]SDA10289.1 DNA primase [Ruminococcus sp. YE78]SFW10853.1 DNA primase [Ruminococcus sp. YE71]
MAFPEEFIDRLKSNNPIADVVGERVSLKRSGNDYVCVCPFHPDNNPSLHVHPDRGFFKCFGCNIGGDVITFVMQYDNLGYYDAVKLLAERANMEMPADDYNGKQRFNTERRKRLYEMNRQAAKFFYSQLKTKEGERCLHYLHVTRGLTPETVKKYGMGFAPKSWTALKNHMMSLGYSEDELIDARLISRSKNNTKNTFDFFVDRAMFPFIDLTGNILGFGGRTLSDDPRKYVNSADSPIYNKKKFLFSLNFAKNTAVKEHKLLLCEGNLDVISLYQAGFQNAVASCGTALTPEQAKLMQTYAQEVVICYDSDEAGQKAADRAIDILGQAGLKTTVIKMKGAKDPDEYVRKFGAAAFRVLIDGADGAVSFRLAKAKAAQDIASESGWVAYKNSAIGILADLSSPAEREFHAHKLAEELGIEFNSVMSEINIELGRRSRSRKKQQRQEELKFEYRRDKVNTERYTHYGLSDAEEIVIAYLYSNPDFLPQLSELTPDRFVTQFNRRVYEFITERMKEGGDWSLTAMNEIFTPVEIGKILSMTERVREEGITAEVAGDSAEKLLSNKPRKTASETSDDELRAMFGQ